MSLQISTKHTQYPVEASYDAEDGGWVTSVALNNQGDVASGSGGSLELAMYSCSRAVLAYEEWLEKKEGRSPWKTPTATWSPRSS